MKRPRHPNAPAHPLETLARGVGRVLADSAKRALARGTEEVLQSVAEDADKALEASDVMLDKVKDKIATIRRTKKP